MADLFSYGSDNRKKDAKKGVVGSFGGPIRFIPPGSAPTADSLEVTRPSGSKAPAPAYAGSKYSYSHGVNMGLRGSAAPQQGPAAPQQGPAAPQQGPAAPQQGPAAPQQGPAAPQQGSPLPTLQGPSAVTAASVSGTKGLAPAVAGTSPGSQSAFAAAFNLITEKGAKQQALQDQRNALLRQLYDRDLGEDEIAGLSPAQQDAVRRGDKALLEYQVMSLNDVMKGRQDQNMQALDYMLQGYKADLDQAETLRAEAERKRSEGLGNLLSVAEKYDLTGLDPTLLGRLQSGEITGEDAIALSKALRSAAGGGLIEVSPFASLWDSVKGEWVATAPGGAGAGGLSAISGLEGSDDISRAWDILAQKLPKDAANRTGAALQRALDSGDLAQAKAIIRQTALNRLPAASQEKAIGYSTGLTGLEEVEKKLAEYAARGGDTGLLSGKAEKFQENVLRSTGDAELARIANDIHLAMIAYRAQISGAAFTESEKEEYLQVFPDIENAPALNDVKIASLKDYFKGQLRGQVTAVLGADAYEALYGEGVGSSELVAQVEANLRAKVKENAQGVPLTDDEYGQLAEYAAKRKAEGASDDEIAAELEEMLGFSQDLGTSGNGPKEVSLGGKEVTVDASVAGKLAAADRDYFAATGKHIAVNEAMRSKQRQAELYAKFKAGKGGRAAPPGKSFHETGKAVDVANWEEAGPYLRKHGFRNDLADDRNHFSIGEFS